MLDPVEAWLERVERAVPYQRERELAEEIVHQVTYECEEPTPLTDTVLELAQAVLERDPR